VAQSLPESLAQAIQKVRLRIARDCELGSSIGEENTKATLVEPILSALGWNPEELDEVRREFRSKAKDKPVDYALFLLRSPRVFVEAKALGEDLNNRRWISQILSYATVVGVEWCVLTNGDEYRIYNSHAPVDAEEKLFRVVRISDATEERLTQQTLELLSKEKVHGNQLSVFWKAQFIDRNVKRVLEEVLRPEDPRVVWLVRRQMRKLGTPLSVRDIRASLKRARIRIDFPIEIPTRKTEPQSNAGQALVAKGRPRRLDSSEADTVVIPARKEGFRDVFLGEDRWYAVRIDATKRTSIKYIAGYQVAPVSAITHIAAVKSIEPWKGTGKVVVNFSEPAKQVGPIPLAKRGRVKAPQNLRYTTREKLMAAKTLDDIW